MSRLKPGAIHRVKSRMDLNYGECTNGKKQMLIAEHMVWLDGRMPSQAVREERGDNDQSPIGRWLKSTKYAERARMMRIHMGFKCD